jgi:hypothetical protein
MTRRLLNTPISTERGGRMPIFWMRQIGAKWSCRECSNEQPKDSVALEVFKKVSWDKGVAQGAQMWICLPCAEKFLDKAKQEVELCRVRGPDGYLMIRDL